MSKRFAKRNITNTTPRLQRNTQKQTTQHPDYEEQPLQKNIDSLTPQSAITQQQTVLQMQRLYGNQMTQQLLQRQDISSTVGEATAESTQEPPEVKERLDMIEKEYRKMITKGRASGYKVAADNMKHFLDGGGDERPLKAKWLRKFSSVIASEEENQTRFQNQSKTKSLDYIAPTLADGETRVVSDYWDSLVDPSEWDKSQWKLYYASGHSTLTSRGEFTLTRAGDTVTISGNVVHSWYDNYDWHEGLSVELPNGEFADDKDALLLQQYRGAAPYKMTSEWTQSVQGTYTIRAGLIPDSSSYTWSGP